MFVDKAKIYIKAGNGGNGIVSFLHMKGIAKGGPDGGNGGNGGNIIFEAVDDMDTLSAFYYKVHYRAENGEPGMPKSCHGKAASDLVVKVPRGTIIRDEETGEVIADMFYINEPKLVQKGGRGGKGNSNFCTPTRRSPSFSQTGEKTEEHSLILELKTIADVGLCGFPNVGKSTLLSMVTAARPKIANYHFTTLSPNLGVVQYHGNSFVMADIPGLIEGASEGAGLGYDFLRHIERTRMLIHIVDMSGSEGRDPVEDYHTIKAELVHYSAKLEGLTEIVVANKMDLPEAADRLEAFKLAYPKLEVYSISAATRQGVDDLMGIIWNKLKDIPKPAPDVMPEFSYEQENNTYFEVIHEEPNVFLIQGPLVNRFEKNVTLDDVDSFRYFEKQLRSLGVIDKLRAAGAKQGDAVWFGDMEFDFVD